MYFPVVLRLSWGFPMAILDSRIEARGGLSVWLRLLNVVLCTRAVFPFTGRSSKSVHAFISDVWTEHTRDRNARQQGDHSHSLGPSTTSSLVNFFIYLFVDRFTRLLSRSMPLSCRESSILALLITHRNSSTTGSPLKIETSRYCSIHG